MPPPRRFIGPFIGIAFVFAALGPPIGGATFVAARASPQGVGRRGRFRLHGRAASLFGHWILLFAAYVVGLGPAVATGVLYALWDAAAPQRWPRALAAASSAASWPIWSRCASPRSARRST